MTPGHLQLVHSDDEPVPCPQCQVWQETCESQREAIQALQEDVANMERDLRKQRRQYTALLNKRNKERREGEKYEVAFEIFEFWRKKCRPRAKSFDDARCDAVLARLKDYEPRYICEAIVGAAVAANRNHSNGVVYNELTLICRDAAHLEDFHQRYENWKAQQCSSPS